MTSMERDNGEKIVLLGPDNATFEILTWCSDPHGQHPEQVHLVIDPTPEIRILYRFTGPKVLTRLIDALRTHREDVWPGYDDSAS